MKHCKAEVTRRQRNNLKKLAKYLLSLSTNYKNFDMGSFALGHACSLKPINLVDIEHHCGTVMCAAGHGPAAGVKPKEYSSYKGWLKYIDDCFFDSNGLEYQWCFNGDWKHTDNTAQGAGKRINYMLKHGIPDNYLEQMEDYEYIFAIDS